MNLENFIETVLTQIIRGTKKAQDATKPPDGDASPVVRHSPGSYSDYSPVVKFDVAISATDSSSEGVEGGITVVGLVKAAGSMSSERSASNTSRIQFEVPVTLPQSLP